MGTTTITKQMNIKYIAILLLVVMAVAVNCQFCMYRTPEVRKLADCTWYNSERSCCSVEDSEEIKNSWEGSTGKFENATVKEAITKVLTSTVYASCVNKLHLFLCFHCVPSQTSYIDPISSILTLKPNLRLCKSYCESMYDSCRLLPISTSPLTTVKEKYSTATSFCEDFLQDMVSNYKVKITDDSGGACFNSGHSIHAKMINIIALTILVVASLYLFQS